MTSRPSRLGAYARAHRILSDLSTSLLYRSLKGITLQHVKKVEHLTLVKSKVALKLVCFIHQSPQVRLIDVPQSTREG